MKQESTDEYLRRNLVCAKAIGARAGIESAIARLGNQERPVKWLLLQLIQEVMKLDAVVAEAVRHRDEVKPG